MFSTVTKTVITIAATVGLLAGTVGVAAAAEQWSGVGHKSIHAAEQWSR